MCQRCTRIDEKLEAAGILASPPGPVAQLVEHLNGIEGVARSSRVRSTSQDLAFALGGFIAGEGSFVVTTKQPPFKDGTPRLHFVLDIQVAQRDRALLEALRDSLGVGSITDKPPRKPHHQPASQFRVASRRSHHAATIPFMEMYLLDSQKLHQFELWRDALYLWEAERPTQYGKGPSPCSEPGCEKPVRGRGLCRTHYYRATGY